jgi:prepilin-type N-terminal cleavage/methylation domain-containing protein
MRENVRSRMRENGGFTLIELLVTMVLMVIVTLAILALLDTTTKVGYSDIARDTSLDEQTLAFNAMTNEIRQAYQINCPTGGCANNASSSYIDFDERVTSPTQRDLRVAFVCNVPQPGVSGEYECVRYETSASDNTDSVPLNSSCSTCSSWVAVQRVVNTSVFTNLTTGTSGSGATRWIAGKATVYTPGTGDLASSLSIFTHDLVLTQSFDIPQLSFGQ